MLFFGAAFMVVAIACGIPAFSGQSGRSFGLFHIGFLIGVVGFVSCAVMALSRWAKAAIEDGDYPVRLPPNRH